MFGQSKRFKLMLSFLTLFSFTDFFGRVACGELNNGEIPYLETIDDLDVFIEPQYLAAQIDTGEVIDCVVNICNDGDEIFIYRIAAESVLFSPNSLPRRRPLNTGPDRPVPRHSFDGSTLNQIGAPDGITKGLAFDGRFLWGLVEDGYSSFLTAFDPRTGQSNGNVQVGIFGDGLGYHRGRLAILRRSILVYVDFQGLILQCVNLRTNTTHDFSFSEDDIYLVSDESLYVLSQSSGTVIANIDVLEQLSYPHCTVEAVEYVPEHEPSPIWLLLKSELNPQFTFAVQCSLSSDCELWRVLDYWLEDTGSGCLTHDGNNLWMTGDSASHVWYQVEDGLSECRWLSTDDDHGEVASQTDRDLFFRLDARRLKRGEYIAAVHLLSGGRPSFDIVIMVYLTVADPLSRPPLSAATTPESCRLQSIYPNPFNCETTICYRIENDSRVSMAVYDLQGRLVKRLLDGQQPGGERRLSWRPADLPAGEYVLRLQSGRGSDVKKLVHLP